MPIQGYLNTLTGTANSVVAVERLGVIFHEPSYAYILNVKESDNAAFRAKYLGVQSLVNIGVALAAGWMLRDRNPTSHTNP